MKNGVECRPISNNELAPCRLAFFSKLDAE